jgi:hypothetical protein
VDILNLFLLILILFLIVLISWIWPPNSPWAPWWRTKKNIADAAFKLAKTTNKDIVYELGSGEATALIVAVQKYGVKGVGVEIDPIRFYLSKLTIWRKGLTGKIKLVRGDIFKENLTEATIVYVYLVPKTLNLLIPKFKKELKKGTKIISYKYEMNLPLKKFDKENELRIYII